jgi:CO/xanthine dehydrogenase Mo-binding subunit
MADIEGSNGQRKEFRIVGRANVPGRLSHSIATGKAKFGSDVVVPNMLCAKFLRSPYGRARIKSLDVSKARLLSGVVDIVTWDDPDIKDMPPAQPQFSDPIPLLANEADMEDEEVGAIVVAESEDICEEALRLIQVDWESLPHILDPRDGMKPDAPILRTNPKGNGNVALNHYAQGDVEAGFKDADQIVEFDWTTALFASHMPNPNGGVAWWYGDPVGTEGPTLFIEGISPTWGIGVNLSN